MNPGTVGAFVLLGRFMRLLPVALRVPPEAGEGEAEIGRRLIVGNRSAKFVERHGDLPHLSARGNLPATHGFALAQGDDFIVHIHRSADMVRDHGHDFAHAKRVF